MRVGYYHQNQKFGYQVKANKETTLFSVLTGSHLYGNASPTSDFDYKAVCLPPLDELLLNTKMTNRKEKPVGVGPGGKMAAGESETEYLPIQVFMDDFFNGQTYALEVAFAVYQNDEPSLSDSGMVVFNPKLPLSTCILVRDIVEDLIELYLTKSVKKMVGYAVSQSKMYGLKTERFTALVATSEAVKTYFLKWSSNQEHFEQNLRKTRLSDTADLLEELCKIPYIKMDTVMNGKGGKEAVPALSVCGKKYVTTSYWSTVLESIHSTIGMYGNRVKEFEGQGVDWKALSHAIRITEQVLELCGQGTLTFPRPNAGFLATVKSGKLSLDEATEYLQNAFSKVDDAILTSVLQDRTPELEKGFREWKLQALRALYGVDG